MKLVVHDASILIDLALSETVDAWFAVGIETWTTDLIYPYEIDREDQRAVLGAYVSAGKLRIRSISADELEILRQVRSGLSVADRSAILLVKELGPDATLATGDRALHTSAVREKVNACGLLKLFELMVQPRSEAVPALPPAVAIAKLERLLAMPGCRIPAHLCHTRIQAWRKLA